MSTFIPPAPPAYSEATAKERAAKLITDVLAPLNLVIALLLLIGWHSTGSIAGIGWGLLAALFCGGIPLSILRFGVRRGRLGDKHIRIRKQRVLPMTASMASVIAGTALLHVLHAPRELFALVIAMLVGLGSTLAVTVWWQISIHNAVAAGAVTILLLAYGPVMLPLVLAIGAIGWSRRLLKAHTLPQLIAGTLVGAAAAATAFSLLR
ncbi:hypothetical protein [Actinacidiphila soli]|uniref:hypothetical protein n=1 Tax=Actinacidiphila soli TaxID=2487275 RepID=UPI000FCAEAEB|nr:hypothetical protein [Actinacidiphila soli]